jgi:hypothetical protein
MLIYSIRSQLKSYQDSILIGKLKKIAFKPLGMKQTEKNFKHKKKPEIKS